jgi:hypothetical protein
MIIPDAERSVLREGDVELSGVLLFEKSGDGGGVRRSVVPRHVRRGWPRNLGGPCFSSGDSGGTESRLSISRTGASAGARAGRQAIWQNKRLPHEVGRWRGEPKLWPKEARCLSDVGREGRGPCTLTSIAVAVAGSGSEVLRVLNQSSPQSRCVQFPLFKRAISPPACRISSRLSE